MMIPNSISAARLAYWQERFETELLSSVIPFWLTHAPDPEYGGYFNCLDRDGQVYDTHGDHTRIGG